MRHRPCPDCDGYGSICARRNHAQLITIDCPGCEGTGEEAK